MHIGMEFFLCFSLFLCVCPCLPVCLCVLPLHLFPLFFPAWFRLVYGIACVDFLVACLWFLFLGWFLFVVVIDRVFIIIISYILFILCVVSFLLGRERKGRRGRGRGRRRRVYIYGRARAGPSFCFFIDLAIYILQLALSWID